MYYEVYELFEKMEELEELLGTKELLIELASALSREELQGSLEWIDRNWDTGIFDE